MDGKPDLAATSAGVNSTVLIGAGGVYSGKLGTYGIWTAGDVAAGWIWNRALSAAEVQSLNSQPFRTIQSRRIVATPASPPAIPAMDVWFVNPFERHRERLEVIPY
ncbi:MAG: hypothetical protein JWN86_425 [Planctomycetota bacterium]|nr:hypothetical protein [Planctomycetota bacterium]